MFGLKRLLKKYAARVQAPRSFTAALWARLSGRYDQRYGTRPSRVPALRFAAAGVSALALVFGMGTGVYAYQSPEVTEGHPLHGLKRAMENVEGRLAMNADARAHFHAKMMDRRLKEAESLDDGQEVRVPLMERAADELGMTVEELKADLRNKETRKDIVNELKESNGRYLKQLRRLSNREEKAGKEAGGETDADTIAEGQPVKLENLPVRMHGKVSELRHRIKDSDLSKEEKRQMFREELFELVEAETKADIQADAERDGEARGETDSDSGDDADEEGED